MDVAIKRYIKRRQRRLDARGFVRIDDDEENNNKPRGGGHGNTRIPFGLCQREGIRVDPNWTPKDAWDALAGKGYSAGEVYRELKTTGKVGKKSSKKAPTKLAETHYEGAFLARSQKKNTMDYVSYLNEHCKDPEVTEFLSMATGSGAKGYPELKIRKSMDGEGCRVRPSWRTSTGDAVSFEITIPQMSKATNPEEKAQAVSSFVHEYTHYLDYLARDGGKPHVAFTGTHKAVTEAIEENDGLSYGDDVKKLFRKYNDGYTALDAEYRKDRANAKRDLAKSMFGGKLPSWLDEDGTTHYTSDYWSDITKVKEYEKAWNKAEKELLEKRNRKTRSYMNGVSTLQGIYDAISGGRLRAKGETKYGHSLSYYSSDPENRAMETLADYVALRVVRPDLADMFRKDKPKIAAALDKTLDEMTKRLRGGE